MIACDFPFSGGSVDVLSHEIKNSEPNFDTPEFKKVSEECKDLIKHLLCKNKEQR